MNRRNFIGTAVATVLGWMGVSPPVDAATEAFDRSTKQLALFYLRVKCVWPDGHETDAWQIVPLRALRDGDVFKASLHGPLCRALGNPHPQKRSVDGEPLFAIICETICPPAPPA